MSDQPPRVIVARTAFWNFAERERLLFDSVRELPTWHLANQSRRVLADYVHKLSETIPVPSKGTVVEGLDGATARQLAAIQLGSLMVRNVGSIIVLISSGYEPEALAPARTTLEILYRGQQVSDDRSGRAAISLLAGRPQVNSLKKLASRYGDRREIEFLDHLAHADVGSSVMLTPRGSRPTTETPIDIRPRRGLVRPATQLYNAGHTAMSFVSRQGIRTVWRVGAVAAGSSGGLSGTAR
jgi:hypothetical protein